MGLLADGPVVWGRALPPAGPGVFLVELAEPLARAPIELTRVGKWIERVEGLELDGERAASKTLAARLGAFWLPSQPVLYVGATDVSISRRVAAMLATPLGDRRPFAGGHWLATLRMPSGTRIWWAATPAVEEYEDALLAAFDAGVPDAERAALPDPEVVLPWANLRRPTGERKSTGVRGALNPEPAQAPVPPTRVVQVPDGDADGARGEPPAARRRPVPSGPTARATRAPSPPVSTKAPERPIVAADAPLPAGAEAMTADGAARLRAELEELTRTRRPEVIARIRAAKELGDLKENADYTSAREEQSFLEGRVQQIEARLRTAVIVAAPSAGTGVGLGSVVTVEIDAEAVSYTIVGSSDSDVAEGRISSASPVGRALMGHVAGDDVSVVTPAGARHYRIVAVD